MSARWLLFVFVCASFLAGASCGSDGGGSGGTGGGGAGGSGGGGSGPTADGPAGMGGGTAVDGPGGEVATRPLETCGDIRQCRFRCGTDASCVAACVSGAPAAARTRYQMLETCSRARCATAEEGCRCDNECIAPNDCIDLLEECLGGAEDLFCETCR